MKVVYLNPTGQMGGAEWSLVNLLNGFRQQSDFTPYVIVAEAGPLVGHCRQLGIETEVLPFPQALNTIGDSHHESPFLSRAGTFFALASGLKPGLEYLARLKAILRRERPDAIHTNGFKMHLAGAWANHKEHGVRQTPLVGHIHDYVSTRPLAGHALRTATAQFSRFVANSHSVAEDIRVFLRTHKVEAIYNAIDTSRFSPGGSIMNIDKRCGLDQAPPGTIRVGLVATFARWKGHITFLQALARLDPSLPIRGYIVGGPIYRTAGSQFSMEELRAEVVRLNIEDKVGFTGFVDDTAAAVRALDIVVHASTKPEPFGMAIVEAMACSKAVIVSDLGGARELFENERTAVGHRPGDVAQLADKMAFLAQNSSFRLDLGRQASTAAHARFKESEMAANFRRVYEAVINSPAAAA